MLSQSIKSEILKYFAPPPDLTTSQWADEYRRLSGEASVEKGRWKTSRATYQKDMMDAPFLFPDAEVIVIMGCAQFGKTEILLNTIGRFEHLDPGPALVMQPNVDPMAKSFAKDRLDPMIRDTEVLKKLFSSNSRKDNTILHKKCPGGVVTVIGANSPASAASRPIRFFFSDEPDRYPRAMGPEGDPFFIALKRTQTFWNRLTYIVGTPTLKNFSRIEAAFEKSNKQYRFLPCYKCGHFQKLEWGHIVWEKDKEGNHLTHTATIKCESCETLWNDAQRLAADRKGKWIAENPSEKKWIGYFIWEAYTPFTTLQRIVDDFLLKKDDPEQFKTYVNLTWGQPWEDRGEKLDDLALFNRREDYGLPLPEEILLITCGVDIQKYFIKGEFVGWGLGKESWGIESFIIIGEFIKPEIQAELTAKLQSVFPHSRDINLKVSCSFVDSGGSYTQQVYEFIKRQTNQRIFAIKGDNQPGKPIISNISTKNRANIPLIFLCVDTLKETLSARLKLKDPGPGYCHFPKSYNEEYFKELTAEQLKTKFKFGFPYTYWEKLPGRKNEALDARNYATGAMEFVMKDHTFEAIHKSLFAKNETKKQPKKQNWVNSWKR